MIKVELSLEDWKNVLASMEAGIRALGFPAFEIGGKLMSHIDQQINAQLPDRVTDGNDD